MNSLTKFLKEVRQEMKKVVWPSKDEAIKLTAIVLGVVIFIGLYIAFLDYIFSRLIRLAVTKS
ncbi:MAG: preprotein translocase subunit SecE [Patescibacteria group bacterium]|nr:preprotein translocase subunit SecE [Patescibacteria group bacterium]